MKYVTGRPCTEDEVLVAHAHRLSRIGEDEGVGGGGTWEDEEDVGGFGV